MSDGPDDTTHPDGGTHPDGDDWFALSELTLRLGGLIWVEEAVGSLLREWTADEPHVGARLAFSETGTHHAWHGEILRGLLATSPALRSTYSVRPPTENWKRAVDELTPVSETATRLLVVTRALHPWLDREFAALCDLSVQTSDRPLVRQLGFAALDHGHDTRVIADVAETVTGGVVPLGATRLVSSLGLVER